MTQFFQPTNLNDALRVLSDKDLNAVPVAGCTDMMVVDHASGRTHQGVVDILRIPELQGVRLDQGVVDIGAATTFSELLKNAEVRRTLPILSEAAATVGAWQIQNRATIGGNIANASPAGDSLPVLLALDAELELVSKEGRRTLSYAQMHSDYRKTALRHGELIARIRIPVPAMGTQQHFNKVGTREAQAISKVVVAFCAKMDGGILTNVRVGVGSVAAIPTRLKGVEDFLEGRIANLDTADETASVAEAEVHPIDDVRSSAEYRRYVTGRVLRRMVLKCGAIP